MTNVPHEDWVRDRGDYTLRINYDLNPNSLVLDIGGYVGSWAGTINEKYGCHVIIYEPVKVFFEGIRERFKGNPKVEVKNVGVSSVSGEATISVPDKDKDGSSLFTQGGTKEVITLEAVSSIIPGSGVDLMKLNVEGCEYDILESLIANNLHTKVKHIQVQFHNFSSDASGRRDRIRESLRRTHKETYCYNFIWENWDLK